MALDCTGCNHCNLRHHGYRVTIQLDKPLNQWKHLTQNHSFTHVSVSWQIR